MGRAVLVARASLATFLSASFVAGCGSNEAPAAVDAGVPESAIEAGIADVSTDGAVADVSGGDSTAPVDAPTEAAHDAPIAGTVATPTCSPAPGTFTSAQMVTLSDATPGATIRFTFDGTNPNANSTPYTTPFGLIQTTQVRAYATAPGLADSAVAACQYVINCPCDLNGPP